MSISWAHFRPHGPLRLQMLQSQLPECWRAFDEAGREHHEHRLGIFPATWPPWTPDVAKPTARVMARI